MTSLLENIKQKAQVLGKEEPTAVVHLQDLISTLESMFNSVMEEVGVLEKRLADLSTQQSSLEDTVQAKFQQLVHLLEKPQEADDISGNEDDILRRLKLAKVVSMCLD